MQFWLVPPVVTVNVNVPALDNLINYLRDKDKAQEVIDNLTKQVNESDAALRAAIESDKAPKP